MVVSGSRVLACHIYVPCCGWGLTRKGPCIHVLKEFRFIKYFTAKVYTVWAHGPIADCQPATYHVACS